VLQAERSRGGQFEKEILLGTGVVDGWNVNCYAVTLVMVGIVN